jgi:glycosyltransferase involved in cell wall biosynthesis
MNDEITTPLVLVQNDEYWLPYVLESVAGVFGRMCIYDVGSTDATPHIIRWYMQKEMHRCEFIHRGLPDCIPAVQGTFRNAMIAEARTPTYFILDADEVYHPAEAKKIPGLALELRDQHLTNPRRRYGLFRRMEFNNDLTHKYSVEREHHRLYTRDAIWTGTHPGERAFYAQNSKTEINFMDEVCCYHFHNATRSSKTARRREDRRGQRSYHPGERVKFDLLEALPLLRDPIADFPVAPELKKLQEEYRAK